jgi:transcriptional regulator with XRE-family HTH domain
MKQDVETLGDFFRQSRVSQERTLEEVAASVGLSAFELDRYEQNRCEIPFDMVFALSNVLNIRPNEVIQLMLQLTQAAAAAKSSQSLPRLRFEP